MATLEERLEAGLAPAWRPDQDDSDTLVGEVIAIDTGTSEYGTGTYPIVTVRQDDGEEKAIHAFHTVIRNELIRQRPQIGERIGVKFLGEQKTKPGSRFNSFIGYALRIDRAQGATFDWASLGAAPDPTDMNPYKEQPTPEEPVDVPPDAGDDGIPY